MATTKGRDKNLIQRRNEKLCERFHYWSEIKRRRFDDVLKILSEEEFFISEQRIMFILRTNGSKKINTAEKYKQLELWDQ